ncbi:calcium-binding protein [Hansschlegelia zhihuaiae]|uniref:Calcium-binding protein n=1 Tax=Hansschlegelia zhihuaiae TaxID=405005 RepID=A0A4Q0MNR8_9HYPH|nr:calcium-binding protein [Hansschlegelia zhihuaiae]RXF75561.1 calcium-binding protein [Hansschlegelia zhihuaiae]
MAVYDNGAGPDVIQGPDESNRFYSSLDDYGGRGVADSDSLTGGSLFDYFEITPGADTIDGGAGQDEFSAVAARISFLGLDPDEPDETTPGDALNLRVDLAAGTYEVDWFTVDLRGTGATDLIVKSSGVLRNIEIVLGTDGDDTLLGSGAEFEVFSGSIGSDVLDGRGGIDQLDLFAPYTADGSKDPVGVVVDGKTHTFKDHYGFTDKYSNIEQFQLSYLDDVFKGGKDDELVYQSGGSDTLDGGDGRDTLTLAYSETGVLVNFATGRIVKGEQGTDTFRNFENIQATGGADTVIGDGEDNSFQGYDGADSLAGGDGKDTLTGGTGDDTLDGGSGDDSLNGNAGKDVMYGGAGVDTVTFATTTGSVEVSLEDKLAVTVDGAETVAEFEIVIGSNYNDVLEGAKGADTLRGGDGDDTLAGGGGKNLLDGGDGIDSVDYEGLEEKGAKIGLILDLETGDAKLGSIQDRLIGVEKVGGTKLADRMAGDGSDNELTGRAGADTMSGGAGDDTLDGGDGRDLVTFEKSTTGVVASLKTGSSAGEGQDRLVGFEDLTGSDLGDELTGTDKANLLDGRGGHDSIVGLGGDDTVKAGGGNDTLDGGDGKDTLEGGEGDDVLTDKAGENRLEGEDGDDRLTGGAEDDTLDGGDDNDSLVAGAGDDDLYGGDGKDTLEGGAGDDEILGGDGDDVMDAGDGRDELDGEEGDDKLSGGKGDKDFQGDEGDDTLKGGAGRDELDGGDDDDLITTGGGVANGVLGNAGDDTMTGGSGSDFFEFYGLQSLSGEPTGSITGDCSGNDVIDGGGGDDQVAYLTATAAVLVDLSKGVATGGGGEDSLKSIEAVLASDFNDTLVGSGRSEAFAGLKGNDSISAGGGNDTINGTAGRDTIDGGAGVDTLIFDSALRVKIKAGDEDNAYKFIDADNATQADTVISIEKFEGSADDDSITGDKKDKDGLKLDGGAGDDLIKGSGGADTVGGGDGRDTIDGGAGRDRLTGGAGSDQLTGGVGGDVFVFDDARGADVVTDFDQGDMIEVKAAAFDLDLPGGDLDDSAFVAAKNPAAAGTKPQFLYDLDDGLLLLDLDGKAGDDPILVATINGAPDLSADDIRIV